VENLQIVICYLMSISVLVSLMFLSCFWIWIGGVRGRRTDHNIWWLQVCYKGRFGTSQFDQYAGYQFAASLHAWFFHRPPTLRQGPLLLKLLCWCAVFVKSCSHQLPSCHFLSLDVILQTVLQPEWDAIDFVS
jgi:hypothetical protein